MPYPLKSSVERSEELQSSLRSNAFSVLVVDDLEVNRLLLARLLQSVGYIAETVPDGESALARLERLPLPDLIVLDLEMPGLSGLETLRHLRQGRLPAAADLPVFIATGNVEESMPEAALAAGADGFFRKPDDLLAMVKAIGQLLSEPRSRRP